MSSLPVSAAGFRPQCRSCYCDVNRAVTGPWPPPPAAPCSRRCDCHGPERSTRSAVYAAAAADAARLAVRRQRLAGRGGRLVIV